MFFERFNPKQQAVFLDLLKKLIMADGAQSEEEKAKFEEFQRAFPNVQPEEVSADILKTIFTTRKERVGVMLELFSVASQEGSINPYDKKFLESTCKEFELSQEDMRWMLMWSESMLFMITTLNNFMED